MFLYHVTKKDNIEQIMKEGLKPQIGNNCNLIQDDTKAVYLTNLEDIPIWGFLLHGESILKIDMDGIATEEFNYSLYGEYMCKEVIPPDRISYYKPYRYRRSYKIESLYMSYIDTINNIAKYTIISHLENEKEEFEMNLHDIESVLAINLQFKEYFSQKDLRCHFKDLGENGEYTIFDTQMGTNKKMYKQLLDIKHYITNRFYKYLIDQFKGCLSLDTGGWEY